jgi:hypothetical protein
MTLELSFEMRFEFYGDDPDTMRVKGFSRRAGNEGWTMMCDCPLNDMPHKTPADAFSPFGSDSK